MNTLRNINRDEQEQVTHAVFVLVDALQKLAYARASEGDIHGVHFLVSQGNSLNRLAHRIKMQFSS